MLYFSPSVIHNNRSASFPDDEIQNHCHHWPFAAREVINRLVSASLRFSFLEEKAAPQTVPTAFMRLLCFFLLAIAMVTGNAASTPIETEITTPDIQGSTHLTTNHWFKISIQRFLRDHKLTTSDEHVNTNGERGVGTAAKKMADHLKLADQLAGWLQKGETADDVFKLLTLDKAADNLLVNPKLKAWISYMKLFNKENPTKKMSLTATLTAHYGDEGLAKLIEAAKQVSSTATLAKRLQSEQIQPVFVLLKLDKAGDQLFNQPQVATWVKYVDDFNQANPGKRVTLYSSLFERFGDETLVQMLIAAKKVPSTEKIADQVQAVQTKLWLAMETSPEDVFKLLKLDKNRHLLFESPLFGAWIKYTDEYRKIYFGTKLTSIDALSKFYGNEALTNMILAAINTPSTAKMARRLEIEQLRNWYIQKDSPKDVFKALNLYESKLAVFENPLYNVWTKYTTYLGAAEPDYKVSLLTNLLDVYGEGDLLKVLRASKKVPTTEKMATDLQDELFKSWLRAQRDPMEIYRLLRVDRVGSDDPNRLLYVKYVKAYAMS